MTLFPVLSGTASISRSRVVTEHRGAMSFGALNLSVYGKVAWLELSAPSAAIWTISSGPGFPEGERSE